MRAYTNFIAERIEQRRRQRRRSVLALAATILVALLAAVLVGGVYQLATERATALHRANARRAMDAPTIIQGGWLRAENERLDLTRRLAVAVHRDNLAQWVALLREVRDRLPAGLWLSGVEIARSDFKPAQPLHPALGKQVLALRGTATNAAAVGEYVEALNRSTWFASAVIVSSRPGTDKVAGPENQPLPAVDYEVRAELVNAIPEGQP